MGYVIKISENLIETMTLAALEAYVLGDGRQNNQIETIGYIWGTKITRDNTIFFNLARGSVSLSAQRTQNWVRPNDQAVQLKNAVLTRWSPEITLLGDFHTHPYENLDEVNQTNGFEFSQGDFDAFLEDDYAWEQSDNNPIMLAVTICEMGAVHGDIFGEQVRNNVFKFNIGEYRVWINVSVGYINEEGEREHTGNTHSPAFLELSRFYNEAGDHLL